MAICVTVDKRSFVELVFVCNVSVLSKGGQEWNFQASCDLCTVYAILVLWPMAICVTIDKRSLGQLAFVCSVRVLSKEVTRMEFSGIV